MTLSAPPASGPEIIERLSPNFDGRPAGTPIDILVLHYTGMATAAAAVDRLTDARSNVSAHYLIDEDGGVVRLVAEDRRAWHAGAAFWRGSTDVNGRSIGIELVNPGHDLGYRPFPDPQMAALAALARGLLDRHRIPARNVVGHSDVAPRRKIDPGELFDWAGLAQAGVGLWPGAAAAVEISDSEARRLLSEFGYETDDLQATIAAFQRHFRPAQIDGVVDRETGGRLGAVVGLCRRA